ncbi:unnamed protein product, partial [Sphacelaria rigidula]
MLRGGVRPIHTREATQAKKGSPPSRTRRSSPTGKVIGIANGIPEAKNDETIIRYDCNVQRITEVSYNLRNPDGVQVERKRGHLLDDGGYHKWRVLINPTKAPLTQGEIEWSKWLESVRKDVECFFSSLKGRFRILKLPILYRRRDDIDKLFLTCCM